jgi:hypothetical protein
MKWWNENVGRFWLGSSAALLAQGVLGSIFHVSLRPVRFDACGTLAMAPAILWALIMCIRAQRRIDFWTRAAVGLGQIIIILAVSSDYWGWPASMVDPWGAFRDWVIIAVVYTAVFAGLTQALSSELPPARFTLRTTCPHCGYSLKGLTVPRCPECGELFDPRFLAANYHSEEHGTPPPET